MKNVILIVLAIVVVLVVAFIFSNWKLILIGLGVMYAIKYARTKKWL